MKDCGTHFEFACVYVDDLACIMAYPHLFFQELRRQGYKLKGVGEISYHLGGDFFGDPDGSSLDSRTPLAGGFSMDPPGFSPIVIKQIMY
jgi:hypothetical protein